MSLSHSKVEELTKTRGKASRLGIFDPIMKMLLNSLIKLQILQLESHIHTLEYANLHGGGCTNMRLDLYQNRDEDFWFANIKGDGFMVNFSGFLPLLVYWRRNLISRANPFKPEELDLSIYEEEEDDLT
ncbi:hypothetical protein Leryth_015602 [Lithospermum erythrorhizon]|nr:hypothetical protein Leryth_015602 [Lithospermum erythrorhizon]